MSARDVSASEPWTGRNHIGTCPILGAKRTRLAPGETEMASDTKAPLPQDVFDRYNTIYGPAWLPHQAAALTFSKLDNFDH